MFTIDLSLKNNPLPLSVQRKTIEAAESLYREILAAMRAGSSDILELTKKKMPEKKVAVYVNEIIAVQLSQKSGASPTGKAPGFAALVSEALAE